MLSRSGFGQKLKRLNLLVLMAISISRADPVDIVPYPQHITFSGSNLSVGSSPWTIVVPPNMSFPCSVAVERVKSAFKKHGLPLPGLSHTIPAAYAIVMGRIGNEPSGLTSAIQSIISNADSLSAQGYSLGFVMSEHKALLLGHDSVGILYGATTLEQLLLGNGNDAHFVVASIRDWPHFKCRVLGRAYQINWGTKGLNSKWQAEFIAYINDYLIPNRINAMSMRFGGFQYHDDQYNQSEYNQAWSDRLRWATAEARKYGIEIEYFDWASCGWETGKQPPYNEVLGWPGLYFCYSRESLIRKIAGEMGQFMGAMGLRQIYLHCQDGNRKPLTVKWATRCSECQKKWPDADPNTVTTEDTIQWGQAQANLGNIYYDELKKYVPDLVLNLVQTQYTGGWEPYQKAFHQDADPNIHVTLRERGSNTISEMRQWHGNGARGFYFYIADHGRACPILTLRSTGAKKYFIGNDQDVHFATFHGGSKRFRYAFTSYYSWNVDAPGSDGAYGLNVPRDIATLKDPSHPARRALEAVARHEFGDKWGPLAVETHLTWLIYGLYGGKNGMNNDTYDWLFRCFQLTGTYSEKRVQLHKIQIPEAERMASVANRIFSEPDVPDRWPEVDLWTVYSQIMHCYLMAEPIYWFEKSNVTRSQDDYNQGYWSTKAKLAEHPGILSRIKGELTRLRFENADIPGKLGMYVDFFERYVNKSVTVFTTSNDTLLVAKGKPFTYKVRYLAGGEINPGGGVSLNYIEKPDWMMVKFDSLWGIAPNELHCLVVELVDGGKTLDTLTLEIKVVDEVGITAPGISNSPTGMWISLLNSKESYPKFVVDVLQQSDLGLSIYNIVGQELWSVTKTNAKPGLHFLPARIGRPNRVIFAAVRLGNRKIVRRFVLVK